MAPYIDAWFALTLVIIGLSHAAQPGLWAEFFNAMKRFSVRQLSSRLPSTTASMLTESSITLKVAHCTPMRLMVWAMRT